MLSPLLVWSLHTSRHMQRDERRPSANQSILLTLLFIYFLSPSATAQLPLCVCERGMGKGVEILVEPLKSSLLATVAIPFPSYYPAIHCSCSPLWQLKKKKHQMKISQGFLVLMQDVRVTVRKPSPDSTPVSKLPCCWVHWGLPREKHLCLQPELSSMAEIKDRCTLPADQAERRTLTHADYCISWLWHPAATLREQTGVCTFRFAFNHAFPLKCTSQG